MSDTYSDGPGIGGVVAFFAIIALIVAFIGGCSGYEKVGGGEVGVVRNGGPLDNRNIRDVVPEGTGYSWVGAFSSVHKYPSQQRQYKFHSNASDQDQADSNEEVLTPTSNGINVGLDVTVYFQLNTDENVLKDFDQKFGTRNYGGKKPHDGGDGWSNFLNAVFKPVLKNNARKQVNAFNCADLVSSCALVQNKGNVAAVNVDKGKNNETLAQIETALTNGLKHDLKAKLGGDYFVDFQVVIEGVALPPKVDGAIDDALASFAEISKSEASVKKAENDAKANEIRQRGYRDCPTCAEIDARRAIPDSIHVWAPNGNASIAVPSNR